MTAKELIAYIEKNHLEYQMVSVLMFNDYNFSFVPVTNPQLLINNSKGTMEVLGFNGINLFSNDYRTPLFVIPQDLKEYGKLNRFLYHPENIRATIVRQNENVVVEFNYGRKQDVARQIRNSVFETFAAFNDIETIEQFNHLFLRTKRIRKNYEKGMGTTAYQRLIQDAMLIQSVRIAGEDWDKVIGSFAIRLYTAFNEVLGNRFSICELSVSLNESISFSAKFLPIAPIKTPLDKPIAIINKDDDISNILYRLSYDLHATKIYIAAGYLYESGLNKILPAIYSVDNNAEYDVEIIVGDLYKYCKGMKCKSPNRATVSLLNILKEKHIISALFTHPNRFYHGKFYYISNGKISYVIMGSSNVTATAYEKNREFDVIYRFDRENGAALETEFINWYESLREECIELNKLDEAMFPSNLDIDEEGTSYGNSILKTITEEEERNRFRFLENFSPSEIKTGLFKGKNFRPFKNYMLFLYPERGVSILEGFSYGQSCYVLSTTDVEVIKQQILAKSKEDVKKTDYYISDVVHDDYYKETLARILTR